MHKLKSRKTKQRSRKDALISALPQESEQKENKELEQLPCVEWGERIDSGKVIARSGKETGFVPGASPSN